MKSIVITGVSTGIGYELAKLLAGQGWQVYGSVRKQADADRIRAELGDAFTPLLFDVTDEAAIATAVAQIPAPLTALINNAGIAEPAPLMHLPLAEFRQH
ncbi:MAG: SDR family NAD(P)-dependent oxidoreductase, partial [Anaerolineae bacterium]|nr:SDR family NAD(P)-dependent oxidoreductase [Anaerolineae bacterium]